MTRHLLMTVDAIGGVWQYAAELSRGLVRHGWTVDLAVIGPPPTTAQVAAVSIPGVTVLDSGCDLDWLAADERALHAIAATVARLARERAADLVQINHPALAVAAYHVPVLSVVHSCLATWWDANEGSALPDSFAWPTECVARGLAMSDAVVCPSAAFADAVARTYALPRAPIVVHNGRQAPAAAGAIHDFAFTAGRLWDRGKNMATLDRAAARLGLPFKAAGALAGPNGERIALEHIHTLGHVGDAVIAGVLSARPIFVSAARYEPFGLAVLEAALAGCALVLSDIPTFRELWDGVATFVPADDAAGFAEAIEAVAADPATRTARGKLARRRALTYNPDRMARAMAALADTLVAADKRHAA